MARADDLVIFDATTGQYPAVMSADVLYRIKGVAKLEHRDSGAINFDMYRFTYENFFLSAYVHPLAHITSTSMSGSIVRARLPIAESVPASELGQLPHAP